MLIIRLLTSHLNHPFDVSVQGASGAVFCFENLAHGIHETHSP